MRSIFMSKKKKYSKELKQAILKEHNEEGTSFHRLGKKYGIDPRCLRQWNYNCKAFGGDALESHNSNLCNYSAEFKETVVREYLECRMSFKDLALKYGILAPSTVGTWVKKYNSHIELEDSRPYERNTDMANKIPGRKTSFEERVEIVEDLIANGRNYTGIAIKYSVSYGQVYAWMRKYDAEGVSGLQDRRGKSKSPDQLNEVERLRAENRLLKALAKQKQMEIDFLKKVEEIERR
jgi:transposase-like protein